jgi:mono/diheme cytochrome c family protein
MKAVWLLVSLLGVVLLAAENPLFVQSATPVHQNDKTQLPPTYVPSGKQMYKEYCASCHGVDGKGRGPIAPSFRKPTPDLTRLSKRYAGTFPEGYVAAVLRFGPGFAAHGSSEMPVWGPIFQYLDNYDEAAVRQRIKNLCDFLESIQER